MGGYRHEGVAVAQNSILPKAQSRLVDQAGQPTREFYHFFNALVNNVTAQIDDLAGVIDNLANVIVALGGDPETGTGIINVAAAVEGKADSSVQILGMQSLNGGGDLTQDRFIYLDGDVETPPGVSFYGSPDGTTKGWAAFSDNFAPAMDEDDNVTLDIAEVLDAGGGILQRTAFDAYGRKTGTSAATTTDLTEGSNLYFTNARADARITVQKGVADGLAPLGSDAKINVSYLPAAVLGQVSYQGTWDASAGTPPTATPEKGWYYIVTVAGTTDLDGITVWDVGDWAIYNGASWDKIDNTDAVVTVNGYAGAVTLTAADVGAATDAQGALADTALQDAPSDGTTYGRKDGAWEATGSGGGAVDSVNGQTGTVVLDAADIGLGDVDNTSDVNKPVSTAQQAALDALLPPGYIDGLQMQWVSGTALTVSSGAAYIEGAGTVLRATSAIAKTSLSLTASTWYHVYLYDNAGTPDVEIGTTAPAEPYNGTARSKTGDASRRYVGSVRTDASSQMMCFLHTLATGDIKYEVTINDANLNVLSLGVAGVSTSVSLSSAIPITSQVASAFIENADTVRIAFISNSITGPAGGSNVLAYLRKSTTITCPLVTNASQQILYAMQSTGSTSGLAIFVTGYTYER